MLAILAVEEADIDGLANQIEQVFSREFDESGAEKNVIMDVVNAQSEIRQADFGGVRLQLHPGRMGGRRRNAGVGHTGAARRILTLARRGVRRNGTVVSVNEFRQQGGARGRSMTSRRKLRGWPSSNCSGCADSEDVGTGLGSLKGLIRARASIWVLGPAVHRRRCGGFARGISRMRQRPQLKNFRAWLRWHRDTGRDVAGVADLLREVFRWIHSPLKRAFRGATGAHRRQNFAPKSTIPGKIRPCRN